MVKVHLHHIFIMMLYLVKKKIMKKEKAFRYDLPEHNGHWAHNLSEAGTILQDAFRQELIAARIKYHEDQIDQLYNEYGCGEREIVKRAMAEWTAEEVATAQAAKKG